MEREKIHHGLCVQITNLDSADEVSEMAEKHVLVREIGISGRALEAIPNMGLFENTYWYVQHDGTRDVGAYSCYEFEPV